MPLTKEKKEAIAESYLNPEKHHEQIMELMRAKGFVVWKEDGQLRADWLSRDEDFTFLDELAEDICLTLDSHDKEYQACVIDQLAQNAVNRSPLFLRLDDNNLPRNPSHKDNPFQHSVEVARKTKTEGLDNWAKFWARFSPWVHDIGKLCISVGDDFQYHAKISEIVLQEYLRSKGIDAEGAKQLSAPIFYHHSLELIDKEIFTHEDILSFFAGMKEELSILGILTVADTRSVGEAYEQYAQRAIQNFSFVFKMAMIDNLADQSFPDMEIKYPKEFLENFMRAQLLGGPVAL